MNVLDELVSARVQIEQLERALVSRVVIEQAKGILAERFGMTIDDAFQILRYGARCSRTSIHELAADVVSTTDTPGPITVALARSSRWRSAQMREHAEAQRERAKLLEARVCDQRERLRAGRSGERDVAPAADRRAQ